MTEIQDILSQLANDFESIFGFELDKSNVIESVLKETPEEISRIASEFKENGLDSTVTTEIDFLLGCLISFIYYKFLFYNSTFGGHVTDEELSRFQSNLISHAPKLKELIV